MAFDLKEIIASRLGENYDLHEKHLNRTLVQAQRVIGFDKVYARAEGALSAMEDLLTFPKRTRMPNLLIVGPTNNGKTMIVERFRRSLRAEFLSNRPAAPSIKAHP